MAGLGYVELGIILVIVLLLFGVGRISKVGEELGRGIRSFREGVREGNEDDAAVEPNNTSGETGEKAAD